MGRASQVRMQSQEVGSTEMALDLLRLSAFHESETLVRNAGGLIAENHNRLSAACHRWADIVLKRHHIHSGNLPLEILPDRRQSPEDTFLQDGGSAKKCPSEYP
jgi:hypothetical protein